MRIAPGGSGKMNPLTKVKLINELNEREAQLGVQEKVSWHTEYRGLPYELTEGDIICVFSQYGEIVNINLVRDKKTGKSKGFCFICYEDQRSTILAVDNFNGIKIKGRTIRVDHVANYRPPKDSDDIDDITKSLREKGCGIKTPPPSSPESSENEELEVKKRKKEKSKKKKKEKKEHRKRVKEELPADAPPAKTKIKVEKEDPGYERYAGTSQQTLNSSGHKNASWAEQEHFKHERMREKSREKGWQNKRERSQEKGKEKDQRGEGSREKSRERHWHDQREGSRERSQEKGRERHWQDQREGSRERSQEKGRERHWHDQREGSRERSQEKGRERHWQDQREGYGEKERERSWQDQREESQERRKERGWQDQRTSHVDRSEEKHKKADDRIRSIESRRSREQWENRDKPSREKESSRHY